MAIELPLRARGSVAKGSKEVSFDRWPAVCIVFFSRVAA
jgi:hypothetical protein